MYRWTSFFFLFFSLRVHAQDDSLISVQRVTSIISILASDSLEGRGNYTPSLYNAAHFIAVEFKKDSLAFLQGIPDYLQPFSPQNIPETKWRDAQGNYKPEKVLLNVVGVIPGDSLPDEAIVFSAHYDHVGKDRSRRDPIYNGANDDASGTTALLSLAHYYAQKKINRRTLIFCAFSGEELGLLGSDFFCQAIDAKKIIAVINIEMIGRTNVSGKNAFFLTGSRYSDLYGIIQNNLVGTSFHMIRDPEISPDLFRRSDNYSFAKLGITAHTIMCSDDRDGCYHQPCDEVKRIDLKNMTQVIRIIPVAVRTIVSGEIRPSALRIDE
ncbi:MAG: M28 family peptidase [Flavisolibacter sp.]